MTPLTTVTSEPEQVAGTPGIFTVGTLRYNKPQLAVLFFWLMWNDFSITLIERIGGSLNILVLRGEGATLTDMWWLGLPGIFLFWLNPFVSTWSDRLRSTWGRRRPFLFVATPFFAFFLAAYPYVPDLHRHLMHYSWFAAIDSHLPMKGVLIMLGTCSFITSIFNGVVLAIFSYLYWDVVPDALQGRFQSMSKVVVLLAGMIWSYYIVGIADTNIKIVYVGTAAFGIVVYMISVWRVKEGEYPPPDSREKLEVLDPIQTPLGVIRSMPLIKFWASIAPLRAYTVECYSKPYFLWIFAGSLFYQIGNQGGTAQFLYLKEDLQLNMTGIGHAQTWGQGLTFLFGIIAGFAVGTLTDKLKPVRLIGPAYLICAFIPWSGFLFIHDTLTYTIYFCVINVFHFCLGVIIAAFTVEVFPREKLGQFCSAQAMFYQLPMYGFGYLAARVFDHVDHHVGFFWQGSFDFMAGLIYIKVFLNWRARHGQTPVPHAG